MPDRRPFDIACDESGYEGEKLVGGTTDVFAHASVSMGTAAATECIQELRDRIRSPALEYKANHVLRAKHRSVLTWLLEPTGPLFGHAHVYLVDKTFLIVATVMRLLADPVAESGGARTDRSNGGSDDALTLYRAAPRFDADAWRSFLTSANDLMRIKDRLDSTTSVDSLFQAVVRLRVAGTPRDGNRMRVDSDRVRLDSDRARGGLRGDVEMDRKVDETLVMLSGARRRAEAFRAALRDGVGVVSAMDPLIPAIVRAVDYWSRVATPVAIIHDRQNTLSGIRGERLAEALRAAATADSDDGALGHVSDVRFVDSRDDPRVQVADFLAGVARKKASEELHGRPDDEITALLRPYVDSLSIWADDRSWRRLRPQSAVSFVH